MKNGVAEGVASDPHDTAVERFLVTFIEFLTQLISRRGLVAAGGYRTKVTIEESRVGDFHETGVEIWAGFGPVGITEKKNILANYEHLFRPNGCRST